MEAGVQELKDVIFYITDIFLNAGRGRKGEAGMIEDKN